MCSNDGEWGGPGWSINLACLPDDYSSATNTAAAATASAACRRDSWRLSALQLDVSLSCSCMRLIYSGGDQQQLVQLFICLSRACKQSLMNLEREYIYASVGDKFCIKNWERSIGTLLSRVFFQLPATSKWAARLWRWSPLSRPQAGTWQASELPEGSLTVIPIIMWLTLPSLVPQLWLCFWRHPW